MRKRFSNRSWNWKRRKRCYWRPLSRALTTKSIQVPVPHNTPHFDFQLQYIENTCYMYVFKLFGHRNTETHTNTHTQLSFALIPSPCQPQSPYSPIRFATFSLSWRRITTLSMRHAESWGWRERRSCRGYRWEWNFFIFDIFIKYLIKYLIWFRFSCVWLWRRH